MRTAIKDFIDDVTSIKHALEEGRFIYAHADIEDLLYRLEWKQSRLKQYAKGASSFPSEDYEWYIKTDLSKYAGEWIAILNQHVVAHDKRINDVVDKAGRFKKRSLFAFVCGKDVMI